jgi:hypothetical protein
MYLGLVFFRHRHPYWPRGLRRTSAAECLLGLWVRIPPVGMDVCLLWVFVLSGRELCDGPIPRPEESYRLWCVSVWTSENKPQHLLWVGRRGKDYETIFHTSTRSPIKRVVDSYPAPFFCLPLSPLPRPTISNLPDPNCSFSIQMI